MARGWPNKKTWLPLELSAGVFEGIGDIRAPQAGNRVHPLGIKQRSLAGNIAQQHAVGRTGKGVQPDIDLDIGKVRAPLAISSVPFLDSPLRWPL